MPGEESNRNYYRDKLSAERLRKVYELATPRIRQYLEAEIEHARSFLEPGMRIIELGCGYGRILRELASGEISTVGIDNSLESLLMARKYVSAVKPMIPICGDASRLPLADKAFDLVLCLQNGISAFQADRKILIGEAYRVIKPNRNILFSSYSEKFWNARLEWFKIQSEAGLLGELDLEKTGDGKIVCRDGFTGTAIKPEELESLTSHLEASVDIYEIDRSSLVCRIQKRG